MSVNRMDSETLLARLVAFDTTSRNSNLLASIGPAP